MCVTFVSIFEFVDYLQEKEAAKFILVHQVIWHTGHLSPIASPDSQVLEH